MAEVIAGDDDLFGEDGDSDSSGGDVPDDPPAEDTHASCGAKPGEEGGVLQRAAMVEALVPSADAPGEAQSEHDQDGSRGGGEEKVKDDATAAPSRPRKQLPGKPPDVAIQAVAASVGKCADVWEGVERGPGGVIVKIRWAGMDLKGSLPVGDWGMPHLTELDVSGNSSLTGNLGATTFPSGLKVVNLRYTGVTSRIDQVQWPETLTFVNLQQCEKITGDISLAQFPAGLKELRFTDCRELTGRIDQFQWPETLTVIELSWCKKLEGRIDQVQWPETLTSVNIEGCGLITGELTAATFPVGLTRLNLHRTKVKAPAGCPKDSDGDLYYADKAACGILLHWLASA